MAPSSSGLGRRPLKAKVAGSNPVGATKLTQATCFAAFLMAPSSSGLGRRPLKAKVAGSNPVGATKCSAGAFASAFLLSAIPPPARAAQYSTQQASQTQYRGGKNSYLDIIIPDIRSLGCAPQVGRRILSTPKQKIGCCLFDMQQAT